MLTGVVLSSLFKHYKEKNIAYCVLRNYEGLPNNLNSSDIDILIDKKYLSKNRDIIIDIAKQYDLIIYNDFNDERIFQFFLYKKLSNNEVFFIKIDFFIQSELYGCCYIDNEEFLSKRKTYKDFFVVDDVNALIDKAVYLYLLGAPIPQRYLDKSEVVIESYSEELLGRLHHILGKKHGTKLFSLLKNKDNITRPISTFERILILTKCFLKNPIEHCYHWPIFIFYAIKYRLFPQGELISFSGPDGCGKTTVLSIVAEFMDQAFRFTDKNLFHHRPSFLPRIANVAKKVGAISQVDENYSEPHRAKPSGILGSTLRLMYYLLDYQLGYFFKIRQFLRRREPVIFDRYFYDVIADCERTNISLPQRLLTWCLLLIPKPTTSFFIDVSPDIVFQRKQELTIESIERVVKRYKKIVSLQEEFIAIGNETLPEETAVTIMDILIHRRAKKLKIND
mgnify:CR=1 FL=1